MDKIKLFFFAALVVVVSCAKEAGSQEESEIVSSVEMVFTASRDAEVQTRTSRLENGDLWWSPSDEIKIFNGTFASGKFISQNSEMAATATFRGSLDAATGTIESGSGSVGFMALYPYDENATCDGSSITFTLPSVQTGADDPFGNGTFPAVAQSNDLNLAFYNVCGGVKFSVAKSGILSVTFKSNGDEPIAGKIRVYFNEEGVPAFDVVDGVTEVVVNAPGSEGFEVGKDYYAILLPSSLSTGFSMVYNRDFQEAKFVTSNQIQVSRSRFGILNQLDKVLEYRPIEGNIVFSDRKMKARLLVKFDTNGDGELSYAEAADVFSLEDVFSNDKSFTSFDEFRYFVKISSIPSSFFSQWSNLTSITIPEGVSSIGSYAFYECKKLISIIIPNSVSIIREKTFYKCESLSSVTFPESLTRIETQAFWGCSSLTSIIIPDGLLSIGTSAFADCSNVISIIAPESVQSIGKWAFQGCSSLSSFDIPKAITCIDEGTFRNCSSLKRIVFPSGLKTIEAYSFQECQNLSSLIIPDGVLYIGFAAFECTGLKSLLIPASVLECNQSFIGCSSLESIIVNSQNPIYDSRDGSNSIIQTETNTLLLGCMNTIIPESVTSIAKNAFSGCSGMKSIIIPESVTSVGIGAFSDCSGLQSIIIPDKVLSIEPFTFDCCSSLSSVIIPENVTSIGYYAFNGCKDLTSVIIPRNVKSIDYNAFSGCESLKMIRIESVIPPIGGNQMFEKTNDCPIYVPGESYYLYSTAEKWLAYAERILPFPEDAPFAVDLGLSVKWGICNLGATKPLDCGDYYAWGETEPYYLSLEPLLWREGKEAGYSWASYRWSKGTDDSLLKYCTKGEYGYDGFIDEKTELDFDDDAAHVSLGVNWRTPTIEEWKELKQKCSWSYVTLGGINGIKVMGANGNYILLPRYPGYRVELYGSGVYNSEKYWTSQIRSDLPDLACSFDLSGSNTYNQRTTGLPIRPVSDYSN